jgi:hydroxymethylbilane synthase
MAAPLLRIGTRGSPLALIQAEAVRHGLAAAHPELAEPGALEVVTIRTTGDVVRDRTLPAIGGKGLFTKEIEAALLAREIDLAVHSLKDMATELPEGLVIACHLPRADPRDAFVSARAKRLLDLPEGAVVGSSELRRQAQLLRARPDLRIVALRGNVETRLGKVSDGKVDAALLAVAGLARLGLESRITEILSTDLMLPAPAQGTIAVEARADDDRVLRYLAPVDDAETAARSIAERALLAALDGSCRTPIAALAEIDAGGRLTLRARIIRPDGTECHEARLSGAVEDAARIGREVGARLRAEAGPGFFDLPIPEGTPV